jgi:hypothetical protein
MSNGTVPALPSPTAPVLVVSIALEQLNVSPARPRRIGEEAVKALAARIETGARLHPLLVVQTSEGSYYVVAGQRRLAALQLLMRRQRIEKTYSVPCRVVGAIPSQEPLLAEEITIACSAHPEKRRRFIELKSRCPGLVTGAEFAARREGEG